MVSARQAVLAGNSIPALPAAVAKKKVPKEKKAPKVKKAPVDQKKPRAYPPYIEMITEAIVALKERTGSSHYAIAKFIEEKQKSNLPANFKKLLFVQLKKLVASGKLVKVKNSFKLAAVSKQSSPEAKKPEAKKAPSKKVDASKAKAPVKAKSSGAVKPKGTPVKKAAAKVVAKPKAVVKPKRKERPAKAAKTTTVTSPGKKTTLKVKKAPVKSVKKPKSIKSPVKKAPAKK